MTLHRKRYVVFTKLKIMVLSPLWISNDKCTKHSCYITFICMQEVEALNVDCHNDLDCWPVHHRSVEIIILYVTDNIPRSCIIATPTNFNKFLLILTEEVSLKIIVTLTFFLEVIRITQKTKDHSFFKRWHGFPVKILLWPWPWIYWKRLLTCHKQWRTPRI